ncbi:hypothetical protein [Pseudoduganella sp. R-43]|uniref:hypothetical protein n=1 Tax=Pseudoduganella sp. R-43 TaxID=3404063 RepID=UPI003CE911F5
MDKQVICPKCDHVRPQDATNPEWQCPACGVCYSKAVSPAQAMPDPRLRERMRAAPEPVPVKHSWNLGLVAKVAVLVVLGWGLNTAVKHRQQAAETEEVQVVEDEQQAGSGEAVANTVLQVSGADVSMLKDMGSKLERSCARNKYGLSEAECIDRIRKRGDLCANQTAARFPGQIGNTDRMQVVVQDYVGCIFER